jgi:hypothetical protein
VLSARRGPLAALVLIGVLAGPMTLSPAAGAKKAVVGGKLSITIPGFSPQTGQSLASGRIKAKKGCDGLRVLRFAYFNADGTPTSQTSSPLTSVVTNPNGSFLVALPQPSGDVPPYTLRIFVEPRKTTFRGRKVRCRAITAAGPVPPPPAF